MGRAKEPLQNHLGVGAQEQRGLPQRQQVRRIAVRPGSGARQLVDFSQSENGQAGVAAGFGCIHAQHAQLDVAGGSVIARC